MDSMPKVTVPALQALKVGFFIAMGYTTFIVILNLVVYLLTPGRVLPPL